MPSAPLPSPPSLTFYLPSPQPIPSPYPNPIALVPTPNPKQLSGITRGVAQAVAEAAAALLASASMLIDVLKGLPAAIAELTGQIADVTEAFAALKVSP